MTKDDQIVLAQILIRMLRGDQVYAAAAGTASDGSALLSLDGTVEVSAYELRVLRRVSTDG